MQTNPDRAGALADQHTAAHDSDGVSYFIEQMGLTSQTDGLPRIAGRIAGYFIIYGGPVSFAQLAEQLKISRGSVSTNARMLVSIGFIEKVAVPGDRQDYYQLSDAPFLRMIDGYLQRMRHMQSIVETADRKIPAHLADTKQRLQQMRHFYREAVLSNELLLARLSGTPDSRN